MELIDRAALIDAIERTDWYHISLQGNLAHGARSDIHTPLYKADDIYKAVEDAPTIDAVPVVRCKDCKHMKLLGNGYRYCLVWRGVNSLGDGGYCNYGERRSDDGSV